MKALTENTKHLHKRRELTVTEADVYTKNGELTVLLCLKDSAHNEYFIKLDRTDLQFLKDCIDTADEDVLADKYC